MNQLISSFKQGNVILFVGAGVSISLGLPSWNSLIDRIAKELGYDPEIYKTFGDNYALAEYYQIKKGISELCIWMDREWCPKPTDIASSKIHELIAKAEFPIIYTTNYDKCLECALDYHQKSYTKIVSIADLTKIELGKTQLIKFHGDFSNEKSIVLGETSYFERLEFETPLDIKLRSDVLGKSFLFIGYSLTDINIRFLFYKLAKLWKDNHNGSAQPRSYIFSPKPNPVQEVILDQWGISMISSEIEDPGEALKEFLGIFV